MAAVAAGCTNLSPGQGEVGGCTALADSAWRL